MGYSGSAGVKHRSRDNTSGTTVAAASRRLQSGQRLLPHYPRARLHFCFEKHCRRHRSSGKPRGAWALAVRMAAFIWLPLSCGNLTPFPNQKVSQQQASQQNVSQRKVPQQSVNIPTRNAPVIADQPRFLKLDATGSPLQDQSVTYAQQNWDCIHDRGTHLIWEVKSASSGLHSKDNRYRWSKPGQTSMDTRAPAADGDYCSASECDTESFLNALRQQAWCGRTEWRMPQREELRSLVSYVVPYPGPTVDSAYFPNAPAQFIWSATEDADDSDSAWGIGFSFGFDYTYLKQHAGYVRAVVAATKSDSRPPDTSCLQYDQTRFEIKPDAEVLDRQKGLTWRRCAWGQLESGDRCVGSATALTIVEATRIAERESQRTGRPWRLPSLAELSGVTELRCHNPAINLTIFPNTPAETFWSGTAFVNSPEHYWLVHFLDGGNLIGNGQVGNGLAGDGLDTALLRLVR